MRLIHFVNIISQKCMSSADVWKYRTQFWVTKTVWQRIPNRRARHRKAPTAETVQSIARYDQLSMSGRTQMLMASDFCCECTTVHQVRQSSSTETSLLTYLLKKATLMPPLPTVLKLRVRWQEGGCFQQWDTKTQWHMLENTALGFIGQNHRKSHQKPLKNT